MLTRVHLLLRLLEMAVHTGGGVAGRLAVAEHGGCGGFPLWIGSLGL